MSARGRASLYERTTRRKLSATTGVQQSVLPFSLSPLPLHAILVFTVRVWHLL